ncbi:MAG: hypothetical protein K9H25_11355 [Rhodospirillum sp.]|nr:hypothetical protein [Rhodospirillum sp.]MCF8489849.1 hypothetical protein [Rhodospirillum sp.]
MTPFHRAPRRLLLLSEDAPPLLLGPGTVIEAGTPEDPGVPRSGGPVALMVEGSALHLETEEVPRLAPWDRGRLTRGYLSATFPDSPLVRGRITQVRSASGEGPSAVLIMAGINGSGDLGVEAWRAGLAHKGIRAVGPFCPALAASGLARWLMASAGDGKRRSDGEPEWSLVVVPGRSGTRLVAARDGLPRLARLVPPNLDGTALVEEVRGTLAYLRRRGYNAGTACALVILADPLPGPLPDQACWDPNPWREALSQAISDGPLFLPDALAQERLFSPPAPNLSGDALLAWVALSDPLALSMPLGPLTAPPRVSGRWGLRPLPLAMGALALGGMAVGLVNLRALDVLEARRPILESDLEEARAGLARERAALAALPATPEALRAFAGIRAPEPSHPRRDLEWIAANLGPGESLRQVDMTRTPLGAEWTLTLDIAEGGVGAGTPEAIRDRLAEAFPGYRVTLRPDEGMGDASVVIVLEPEDRL